MTKEPDNQLLKQQTVVLKGISYTVAVCFAIFTVFIYKALGEDSYMPYLFFLYVAGILLNLAGMKYHHKAMLAYKVMIYISYAMTIVFILYTGGFESPAVFILCTLPVGAFNTSRKQGKIWVAIALASFVILYFSQALGIPVKNVIPEEQRQLFLMAMVLFVFALITVFSVIFKYSSYNLYRAHMVASGQLDEKKKRLDHLVNLVNHTPVLMCVIDLNSLTFVEVNPYFKQELRYELVEVRGRKISDIVREETLPEKLKMQGNSLKDGQMISFECMVLYKTGIEKLFQWNAIAKRGKLYANAREIQTKK